MTAWHGQQGGEPAPSTTPDEGAEDKPPSPPTPHTLSPGSDGLFRSVLCKPQCAFIFLILFANDCAPYAPLPAPDFSVLTAFPGGCRVHQEVGQPREPRHPGAPATRPVVQPRSADAGVRGGLARGRRNPSPGRVPKISSPEGTSQRPQNDCTNICSGVVTSQVLSRAPVYTWDGTGAIQPCPPAASRFRQRRSGERPLLFLRRRGGRGSWGRTRDPDTGMGGGSLL